MATSFSEGKSREGGEPDAKLPEKVFIRDYDKVLGISLCLLAQRVIGRCHHKYTPGVNNKFTYKKALLEELDSFQAQLVFADEVQEDQSEDPEAIARQKQAISQADQIKECFFYFDAALRRIMFDQQETDGIPVDELDEAEELAEIISEREKRIYDLRKRWKEKRRLLKSMQLHELFWEASTRAYQLFSSLFNEWVTLEVVAGLSRTDYDNSFLAFKNLLVGTKILVACAYFRQLEKTQLGIEREYTNDIISEKTPADIVESLMASSFVSESKRSLKAKLPNTKPFHQVLGSMLGRAHRKRNNKPAKEKKIHDLPFPIGATLSLSLVIDQIVAKYDKGDDALGKFYKTFQMEKYPSVFQKRATHPAELLPDAKVEAEDDFERESSLNANSMSIGTEPSKKKKKQMEKKERERAKMKSLMRRRANVRPADGGISRLALITEDSDTSLLTKSESNTVQIIEAASLKVEDVSVKPLARIDTVSGEITAVASNRSWMAFGTASGSVFLYKIDSRGLKDMETSGDNVFASLQQPYAISAMILDSTDSRLFIGDVTGRISEWALNSDKGCESSPVNFTANVKEDLYEVSCLATDERPTLTTRFQSKFLFSGHSDGSVFLWNTLAEADSRKSFRLEAHKGQQITAIATSDYLIYTTANDKALKVWTDIIAKAKKQLLQADKETENKDPEPDPVPSEIINFEITPTAIAVEYQVVIVGSGSSLYFYEKNDMKLVETLNLGETPIYSMTIDRRRRLYTVDEHIRIWDLEGLLQTIDLFPEAKKKSIRDIASNREELDKDTKLSYILGEPALRREFHKHLQAHHAEENLHFWLLVETYEFIGETASKRNLGKVGMEIILEHIGKDAVHEVNFGADMADPLLKLGIDNFDLKTFSRTKHEVFALMDRNYRFSFIKQYNLNITPSEGVPEPTSQRPRGGSFAVMSIFKKT